jgi:single-strand DNA-binding protein
MANDTTITIEGNLAAEPELRYTANGNGVASFTIASTPRALNRQTGEWVDGETLWMRCSAWGRLAENVAESLRKGVAVVARGDLKQREYTDKTGVQRTTIEMTVHNIGPSLRNAQATVMRNERGGQAPAAPAAGDPWQTGWTR